MFVRKIPRYAAAIVLLGVAALALWRLIVDFPITIGGYFVGHWSSFLVLVVCLGLALALIFSERDTS